MTYEEESLDDLFAQWEDRTGKLRHVADRARWLAATLTELAGSDPSNELPQAVEDFTAIVETANREDFESLILLTTQLHHRGAGVLNPDRGPVPVPSPFVRRMPETQEEIEAKRDQRQVRHVRAYETHIIQSLEHFVLAWNALVDGSLICDWDMVDDEFPKLAALADEARRAFAIWSSINQ